MITPNTGGPDWGSWQLHMLPEAAADLAQRMEAAGLTPTLRLALNLIEDAGTLVGAYRRWAELPSLAGKFADELAEVLIGVYVTAHNLGLLEAIGGVDLDRKPSRETDSIDEHLGRIPLSSGSRKVAVRASYVQHIAHVMALLADAMFTEQASQDRLTGLLHRIVNGVWVGADALGVDLRAAVASRLANAYALGWRDPAVSDG